MRGAGPTGESAAMFGKSEKGKATIVARQVHEGLYKLKGHTGIYRNIWDYIADVVPDGGEEPFRATFTEIFEGASRVVSRRWGSRRRSPSTRSARSSSTARRCTTSGRPPRRRRRAGS